MTDKALTIDQFVAAIEDDLAHEVDQMILRAPDQDIRLILMRNREKILREYRTHTLIANLRARNAELEARLQPRLVN
jgi:hypothetical protein